MQMKSIFASQLLFKAGLIALLNLELDEWLFAMDSDSEVYLKYNIIYVQNMETFNLFLKKIHLQFSQPFSALFSIWNVECFLRGISNRDSHFQPPRLP